ncbi:hypothetical protein DM02DRAFT_342728 [Periconia macrospinosa]|uniref:DUF7587 domain-containing protein n=1 Tax=Periconia macrospinosa TaxID=97972 RepID=A0A2V1D1R9_9PLEO|nr:hypothetical protein DM02DRAFT_342728 [Periconia macrospinosa]
MNRFSPTSETHPPRFLFRVECHDQSSRYYNCSFTNFHMTARFPTRIVNESAFRDHFSWSHTPTPFLSFSNDWNKALARRRWMLDNGAKDIVLIAVETRDLRNVYNAYDVARCLGYTDNTRNRRRRLSKHCGEFLVVGGIHADEYRIIATFPGDGPERLVSLSIPKSYSP